MQVFRIVLVLLAFASNACLFAQAKDSVGVLKDEKVVTVVETIPAFSYNGLSIAEFVAKNLKYPQAMIDQNREANIHVYFTIDTNGLVSNVIAKEQDNASLQVFVQEAVRVVKLTSNHWLPGRMNGKKVKMRLNLPINFRLEE